MPDWPHAPIHRFNTEGTFFITGGMYQKQHIYQLRRALDSLQDRLFGLAEKHGCALQAWALLSNHYRLVIDGAGEKIHRMLSELHSLGAIDRNRADKTPGRKVWYQFRETQLTFERSWMARLRYTHENAVHHQLVNVATAYPWCSASWFARTARPAFVRTVMSYGISRIAVRDDFDVAVSD